MKTFVHVRMSIMKKSQLFALVSSLSLVMLSLPAVSQNAAPMAPAAAPIVAGAPGAHAVVAKGKKAHKKHHRKGKRHHRKHNKMAKPMAPAMPAAAPAHMPMPAVKQ